MIEYILIIITILGAVLALIQRDLLKAAILTGVPGASIAFLYQYLLALDVALTGYCRISYSSVFALAAYKTRRVEE